jgi:hypothetical protein
MTENVLKATHEGVLTIGDSILHCAVLEDETSVLTQGDFLGAIGRVKKSKKVVSKLPPFLSADNLKPFINKDLERSSTPIVFKAKKGGGRRGIAYGYKAELLPQVCNVFLQARDAGVLKSSQLHIALHCEILVRALATVGIIALVHEATGYQYDRDRDRLEQLLAIYLSEERLRWAKTFPDIFYRLIYKLKGWSYPSGSQKSRIIGNITNQLIYDKLPPGVLPKLRELNPKDPKTGRRKAKFFQHLSADVGQPDLRDHLLQVIALLRAASNWHVFDRLFKRAFPTYAELEEQRQKSFPLPEMEDDLI